MPSSSPYRRAISQENGSTAESSSTKASPTSLDNNRGRQLTRETAVNPLSIENLRLRGYHILHSSFRPFYVERRWRMVRELGQGAYGMVVSAEDKISGETVAIKMVTRVFDKLQLAKRALREITLLRHFSTKGHENITGLIDIDAIHPNFTELYLFMEPMEADLHQIIRSGQTLTSEHVQYFLYQILRGIKYIHTASVMHRDLKPGNILVNSSCELKICDFGLANTFEGINPLTEYVATRWYRAPEIMLSFRTYTTAIDIWSIGCILAELLLGKPLFRGKDYVDQLNRILDFLGSPDDAIIQRICSEKAKAYVRSLPIRKPQSFQQIFPAADAQVLDLLSKMITWDPDTRITVQEALAHPWVANYHDPMDEPSCPNKFERYKEYEDLTTLEEFRNAIWDEIQDFRKEVRSLHPPPIKEDPVETVSSAPFSPPALPVPEVPIVEPPGSAVDLAPMPKPLDGVEMQPSNPQEEASQDEKALASSVPRDRSGLVTIADPIAAYRRRSSVLLASQPGVSPHGHSRGSSQAFPSSTQNENIVDGAYVVPARSRTASIMGGQSQLLRTLSTFSIHEQLEDGYGNMVVGQKTAADAPPSSIPREFVNRDVE